MKTVKLTCLQCTSVFHAYKKEVKRREVKFCSRTCFGKYQTEHRQPKAPNVTCAYCSVPFYKNSSKKRNSKHGIFFCCRSHKDLGQRLDSNITQIQPDHYRDGRRSYRKRAFGVYAHVCNRCSYSEHPSILIVHHKDRNRLNNSVENLEILCRNCHELEHRTSLSS